ncbi:MAG: excinuclease ABC subunit UvrB [bacterium]|nr:excinuclease ABC subunit UvrB [bacterium]
MSDGFKLISKFKPEGDQPQAIKKLTQNLREGLPFQTLLGVTGSGKTFTMASVIEQLQRPTLIISHNKTLAAQLYQEFKEFFPENAVHYFVSYYDYYQPEAYIPHSDTYIEKDASINELIDRLRHASTQSILSRPDTLIVASVSCIYGIGEPAEYEQASIRLAVGEHRPRKDILRQLAKLQFARNDISPLSGTYNAKGDAVEVRSMTGLEVIRIEWHGNVIDRIEVGESRLEGTDWQKRDGIRIFPAKHFVTPQHKLALAIENIKAELKERLAILKKQEKLLEAQRLGERTKYDLEMIRETGYCTGIENYSRHLDFRKPGTPPATLIDYFKHAYSQSDWLLFIDESHMTIPQIRGMYHGDRARKDVLVEYGFRLPSAMDNRPLTFEEFLRRVPQTVFVSATPNVYEHSQSKAVVEQLIRPTGLLDPVVEVLPTEGQIPRLVKEIAACVKKNERALVVTITKRLAEELTEYLKEKGVKVQYLHSEVKTLDRPEILKDLREGKYDVVVGINLLREGLDLPEVSLVAILDADKEGFLRNETTLIQTIGRAARHINGRVIMFADAVTESMRRAIDETVRRRKVQEAYNTEHGITPKTIRKAIKAWEFATYKETVDPMQDFMKGLLEREGFKDLSGIIKSLEKEMKSAAKDLDFEKAATIRDQIAALKKRR